MPKRENKKEVIKLSSSFGNTFIATEGSTSFSSDLMQLL
jgi:hypothetical protein